MKKYILDEINSETDFYIIHDNKGNTYEYHLDTKDVFVINRYEGDEGEIMKDNIAKEIRNFCNDLKRRFRKGHKYEQYREEKQIKKEI